MRTIGPDASAREAARRMEEWHVGSLIVVREDRPIGIVTDRDLALGILIARRDAGASTVGELMTRDPVVIGPECGMGEAAKRMRQHGLRKLPRVDVQGRLVGVLTADDLVLALGRYARSLSEVVRRQLRNARWSKSQASRRFGRE